MSSGKRLKAKPDRQRPTQPVGTTVGRSCILPDTGDRMITAVDCTIVRFKQAQYQTGR